MNFHILPPAFAALWATLLLTGCVPMADSSDSARDDSAAAPADTACPEPEYPAQNDIGMTVRSAANTFNLGESLDSTSYNFEGVLTDGIGMPLFTDITGMPGVWEVEVLDSTQVRIRNLSPGNLQPHQLVEYLTTTLDPESDNILCEGEHDEGETHIVLYRYGRTRLSITTRPEPIGDTGEVAPVMEITLKSMPEKYLPN